MTLLICPTEARASDLPQGHARLTSSLSFLTYFPPLLYQVPFCMFPHLMYLEWTIFAYTLSARCIRVRYCNGFVAQCTYYTAHGLGYPLISQCNHGEAPYTTARPGLVAIHHCPAVTRHWQRSEGEARGSDWHRGLGLVWWQDHLWVASQRVLSSSFIQMSWQRKQRKNGHQRFMTIIVCLSRRKQHQQVTSSR